MKKRRIPCDDKLLEKIAKSLGPSLYNKDAKLVAASDKKEMATIKRNFIGKKLGIKDEKKQDAALNAAITKIGKSNRYKLRAVFYYLIVKETKKTSIYK